MEEKTFFKPFRKYDLDQKRLHRWYLASLYSYNETVESIDSIESEEIKKEKILYKDTHVIAHNLYEMKRKYRKNFVSFLEEMTIIRIISILENFLLDAIKIAFYHDKTCFYDPKQVVEFPVSEFLYKNMNQLEEKFIDGKISNLHRQGFNEVMKFYKKVFNIDFNSFNTTIDSQSYGIKQINKIHDIRHLFVHRLGKTDSKFKRDYDYNHPNIVLSEEEVLLNLQVVDNFVLFIKNKFTEKWFE